MFLECDFTIYKKYPNFDFWFSHSWDWFTPWALRGVSNQKVAKTISDQGLILEGFLMLKV